MESIAKILERLMRDRVLLWCLRAIGFALVLSSLAIPVIAWRTALGM